MLTFTASHTQNVSINRTESTRITRLFAQLPKILAESMFKSMALVENEWQMVLVENEWQYAS